MFEFIADEKIFVFSLALCLFLLYNACVDLERRLIEKINPKIKWRCFFWQEVY